MPALPYQQDKTDEIVRKRLHPGALAAKWPELSEKAPIDEVANRWRHAYYGNLGHEFHYPFKWGYNPRKLRWGAFSPYYRNMPVALLAAALDDALGTTTVR